MVVESPASNCSLTYESLDEANLDEREFDVPGNYSEFSLPKLSLPELLGP